MICIYAGAVFFLCTSVFAQENKHYEIGILADRGKDVAVQHWKPLADYLSAHLDPASFSIVPLTYEELYTAVQNKNIDFVVANPGVVVELMYFHDIQILTSMKRLIRNKGYNVYGGVVFTRRDRDDITDLRDFRGKKFAAVHENSFGGWLLPAYEFQWFGFDVQRSFKALNFLGTQDKVVYAVLQGKADGGSVSSGILEIMEDEGKISLNDFKVIHGRTHNVMVELLHSTDLYPEWSLIKLGHVVDSIGQDVTAILYDIPEDHPVLEAAGCSEWVVPYNYSSVRRAIRDLQEGSIRISVKKMYTALLKEYKYVFFILLLIILYMVVITLQRSALNKVLVQSKAALEKELAEHKRAEDALRESQEMLQMVLNLIPARVFWKDRNSVFLGCNKKVAQDAGLNDSKDLIGKTDDDMVWKEQARHYREDDLRVMSSGKPLYNIIEPQTHEGGQEILLRMNKIPMRNASGQVIGILGTYEDITEAKRAQEALERSEAKYRELVQNANSIILRMNHKGEVTFFNEYAQRFFGFTEDEILGKSVVGTIVPPVDQKGHDLNRMIQGIVTRTDDYSLNENKNMTKTGERVWIAWANKTIINEDGEKEVLSIGTDMTQRRKMEEELLRLSYALEQSQNIILMTDINGAIQYVNPKFSDVTGYKREEVLGKNPRILKSGELSQDVYRQLWETISSGSTWRGEFHNRKKNGNLFWERGTISPIKDRYGAIVSYLAVKEDITQEKQLAQDLQKAFGRLKEMERIINLSNAIVFMWSPQGDGSVKFVSDNIRVLGFEPEDFYVRGMKLKDMVLEDDRETFMAVIKRHVAARRLEFSQQYRVKGPDGKIRWFEEHSFVTYSKTGEPEYIQGVAFDITERKIAEERMLEAVNMKSEFISIVSHELRTPLTAVKESINIVAEGDTGALNEGQSKFLGIAKRNVDRLGSLINDVLDYQKLDMGKLNFDWEEVDIRPLVAEAVKTMDIVAKNKNLNLQMSLPDGDFPKIHADPNRIIQVLNNLINNAIKFTERGHIRVEAVARAESVQVFVKDTGIGIRAQDMHKLFQTFSQVRSGSERRSGETGLGLAISKKIIDSHGGSIWAESVFGQGTTFTFMLPIKV
jgi:PAS domain S-box-containing protein